MAGIAFSTPTGGLWPLGLITVTTAGTPVPLNGNVGPQKQGAMQMARRLRQLIFSKPLSAAAGDKIYLMYGNYDKAKTNRVVAVITCGKSGTPAATDPQPVAVPPLPLMDGLPTPDVFYLDSDASGATVQVTAVYA